MSDWNRFGASVAQVMGLLPGMVSADVGGDTAVGNIMDRYVDDIASAMPADLMQALRNPKQVLKLAAGASTITLAGIPVVAGSETVFLVDKASACLEGSEVETTQFSLVDATGVITFSTTLRSSTQASWFRVEYQADVDNASWSCGSLAVLTAWGAASEIATSYQFDDQHRERLQKLYDERLTAMREGRWAPNEVLRYSYCPPIIIRRGGGMRSVLLARG